VSQPGSLNSDETLKASRWDVGRGVPLPKGVGSTDGPCPSLENFQNFTPEEATF